MKVNCFVDAKYGANCYVVTNDDLAIIIDPCVPYNTLKKYLENKDIPYILITHGHIDHFHNLEELKRKTNAKIVCHHYAKEKIENAEKNCSLLFNAEFTLNYPLTDYIFINENTVLPFGKFLIKNLYTPGHTNCSVCFMIDNLLFSGDTLFKNSIGRYDLYSSNSHDMLRSINKIKCLNPIYVVYPGHDESTTLEEEILNNRYLNRIK